ncbi:hypothetical protein J5X84_36110 [Streptosporangiaceae bacterium NEAU-GS5]|nr:hypothetical protein [Streptosporangiaceae bacterium NEAU-GS5]
MGYKRQKLVKLTWADGEFQGLEVRVRRVSVGKLLKLLPLMDGLDIDKADEAEALLLEFGSLLAGWNLEDEDTGDPVECTPEAFIEQDLEFMMEIVQQYGANIAGVAAPLEQPSPSGEQFQEASLPMGDL